MELPPLLYKATSLSNDKSVTHPTLVLLHGRGTDENDLLELAPYFSPHLQIISVQAPYRFQFGGYTWFDLDETNNVNIEQLIDSIDALGKCLDEVQIKYSIDTENLFLFGFSMGAMMSLTISLSNPNKFKGVIAHSGMLLQHKKLIYKWNEIGRTSYFIAHGKYDPIVPIEAGREAHQRLLQSNAKIIYREYPIQHNISEESINDITDWLQKQL